MIGGQGRKGPADDALARSPRHRFSGSFGERPDQARRGDDRRRRGGVLFFFLEPSRRRCCPASLPRPGVHAKATDTHTHSSCGSIPRALCVARTKYPFCQALCRCSRARAFPDRPEHIHIFSVLFSLCVPVCAIVERACALIRRVDDVRVPRGRGVACQAYQQLCQYAYALLTTTTWAKAEAARPRSC